MQNKIGGWSAVFVFDNGEVSYISGFQRGDDVTNNRMELTGVIQGLRYVALHHPNEPVEVISDSEYVVKGITDRVDGWILKGWRNTTGIVKNKDLWEILVFLRNKIKPTFNWVRGHDGNQYNEIADKACVDAYRNELTK